MELELSQKHNDAAFRLVQFGIELNSSNAAYLLTYLALIAGRELQKQVLGEKLQAVTPGTVILNATISNRIPELLDFLLWLGEELQLPEPDDTGRRMPDDQLHAILGLIKENEKPIDAIFLKAGIALPERPYTALLAVAKVVEMARNSPDSNCTFSDAVASSAAAIMVGSKTAL